MNLFKLSKLFPLSFVLPFPITGLAKLSYNYFFSYKDLFVVGFKKIYTPSLPKKKVQARFLGQRIII